MDRRIYLIFAHLGVAYVLPQPVLHPSVASVRAFSWAPALEPAVSVPSPGPEPGTSSAGWSGLVVLALAAAVARPARRVPSPAGHLAEKTVRTAGSGPVPAAQHARCLRNVDRVRGRVSMAAAGGDVPVVPPGAPVLVVGNGPVQVLAARIAAIRGYETTLACAPQSIEESKQYLYDEKYSEGSIPLKIIPIAGDQFDAQALNDAVSTAQGFIVAFDNEKDLLPESTLNIFMPTDGSVVKRVAVMSRYLNGSGMGFIPKSAKYAANPEIWAGGDAALISKYKSMEKAVQSRAGELGACATVIRAGTLKGGASGDSQKGGNGEPTFLDPLFYKRGVQDVANWRLLFDCGALGVKLTRGDTLPGPGPTAAFTALDRGAGDSHRGAVATALVESLRSVSAADQDFSIGAEKGDTFPSESEWPALFDNAA